MGLKKIHFLLICICCCNPQYKEKKAKYNEYIPGYDSNDENEAFHKFVTSHDFTVKPGINLFEYSIDTQESPDYMLQYVPNEEKQQYSINIIDLQKNFNVIKYIGSKNQLKKDEIKDINQLLVLKGNQYRVLVIYNNEKREINIDASNKDRLLNLSEYQKNTNVKNIYIEVIRK